MATLFKLEEISERDYSDYIKKAEKRVYNKIKSQNRSSSPWKWFLAPLGLVIVTAITLAAILLNNNIKSFDQEFDMYINDIDREISTLEQSQTEDFNEIENTIFSEVD